MADLRKYLQTQRFTLSASISLLDTTIALTSFNFPDGTAIVAGDLGTLNFATLEPGTTREEQITFTGLTDTSLTGVTRGIRFDSPYTQDTALRVPHASGAIIVISNTAAFYDSFANKENDETVTGIFSFTQVPNSSNQAVGGTDLVNLDQLNAAALGTANINKLIVAGNAGEVVAAGDWVFLDPADSEWKKTDASIAATADQIKIGVAQGAGVDAGAIAGGILVSGLDENQSGLTPNTTQFLSDTAGAIASTPGTVERAVGIAISTTQVILDPYFADYVIADQVDALAGSSGTPSTTNKYITEDDVAENIASKVVRRVADGTIAGVPNFFGDGDDGALTTTGNLSLTRDIYHTTLIVSTGDTITTNGFRIFASVSVAVDGTIERNGNNGGNASTGTGGAAGVGLSNASLAGSVAGGVGPNGNSGNPQAGAAGGAGGATPFSIGTAAATGGAGGLGGAGAGGAGGAAGTFTVATSTPHVSSTIITGGDFSVGTFTQWDSSPGGGSGGAGGNNDPGGTSGGGGGGSSSGGVIFVAAPTITINASGIIQSNGGIGGNGGDGTSANNSGGGGGGAGGNGGVLLLVSSTITNNGTLQAVGGTGGAGGTGPGAAADGSVGSNGNVGAIFQFII